MKLLVVEDEEDLAFFLGKILEKKNYAVDIAMDGEEALAMYEINHYDGILLDLNLPKKDGLAVLKEIRLKDAEMRIMILSARSQVEERIIGLDLGANDYLIKPFDIEEVDARLRALFRRKFQTSEETCTLGKIQLHRNKRRVFYQNQELLLTPKEYGILEYLMTHAGEIISGEELIEHVWNSEVDLFSNGLKFQIHALRKKISDSGFNEPFIQTVRGKGYYIEGDSQ